MSKTEKILFIVLGILILLLITTHLCIDFFHKPYVEEDESLVDPRYIYVSTSPEIHLLWNSAGYVYVGAGEINGESIDFILRNDCDKIYAFPCVHFAHIDHPDLFYGDICKCTPLFEGDSSYVPGSFTIKVTKDYAGIFSEKLPFLTFVRYDISTYEDGAFAHKITFGHYNTGYIYVSDTHKLSLIWDDSEDAFVGIFEKDNTVTEFVLFEEGDSVYALPAAHLAHMAHPSLFKDDTCLTSPLFEGKLTYKDGLANLRITKDSANLFDGDLPTIEFTKFDKWEYFNSDTQ